MMQSPRKFGMILKGLLNREGKCNHARHPTSPDLQKLSPRSNSVTKGAALAYQVAVLGGDGGEGASSHARGSEALVEAGMVNVLMRVAGRKTAATWSPLGEEIGTVTVAFTFFVFTRAMICATSLYRPPKYTTRTHSPTQPPTHPPPRNM